MPFPGLKAVSQLAYQQPVIFNNLLNRNLTNKPKDSVTHCTDPLFLMTS